MKYQNILRPAILILILGTLMFSTNALIWGTTGLISLQTPTNNSVFFDLNTSYEFTGNSSTSGAALVNLTLYNNFTGTWHANQTIVNISVAKTTDQSTAIVYDTTTGTAQAGLNFNTSSQTAAIDSVGITIGAVADAPDRVNITSIDGSVNYGSAAIVGTVANFTPDVQLSANTYYRIVAFDNDGTTHDARVKTSVSFPISNSIITWINGTGGTATTAYSIQNLTLIPSNATDSYNWSFNTSVNFGTNFAWNVEGCSSDNTCGFGSPNFTLSRGLFINNQTYNPTTSEGSAEFFELNFSMTGKTLQNVILTYNNTNYTNAVANTGTSYSIPITLNVPVVTANTNVSFFWNLAFTDGTFITTTPNNQTVNNINIDDCSTYTVLIYNYSLRDEASKAILSNDTSSIEIALDFYDTGEQNKIINFSKLYTNKNPAQICLESNLTTEQYRVYSTVKYSANTTATSSTFATEYYNVLNGTLSNSTIPNNINLYDLNNLDATDFQLTFRDSSYVLAPDILVYLYRQYVSDNDFKVVEAPLTDSNGQTILHMVRNDIVYNLVMVDKGGVIVATFNNVIAFCDDFTIGQCTINLNAPPSVTDLYDFNTDLGISFTQPTYSNVTQLVSIDFVSTNLSIVNVSMEVLKNGNFGNRSLCMDSLEAVSGTLNCNVSAIVSTDRYLFINLFVNGDLKTMIPIDLKGNVSAFGITTGAFFAFLLILFLTTFAMEDKKVLLVVLIIGWVLVIGFGLLKGAILGAYAAGLWLIISIAIVLWKIGRKGDS